MKKQSFSYRTKQSAVVSLLIISPPIKTEQAFQDYSADSVIAPLVDLNLTDCLNAIEQRYRFQGDIAIFILSSAMAAHSECPPIVNGVGIAPSLADGGVK